MMVDGRLTDLEIKQKDDIGENLKGVPEEFVHEEIADHPEGLERLAGFAAYHGNPLHEIITAA